MLPFALVLLILGLAAAGGVLLWGVIGLAILLGIYLIFWTFDIDEAIIEAIRSSSSDIRTGSVAFGFGLTTVALVGVGFLTGYNLYAGSSEPLLDRVLLFLQAALLWWILGALLWETGRAIRRMFSQGTFPRSFLVATTSIVGIGLVSYGLVFLGRFLQGITGCSDVPLLAGLIVTGLGLVIGAGVIQQRFKSIDRNATPPTTFGVAVGDRSAASRSRSSRGTSSPHRSRRVVRTASTPGAISRGARREGPQVLPVVPGKDDPGPRRAGDLLGIVRRRERRAARCAGTRRSRSVAARSARTWSTASRRLSPVSVISSATSTVSPRTGPESPSVSEAMPSRVAVTPQCWARNDTRRFTPSRSASRRDGTQPPRVSPTIVSGTRSEARTRSAIASAHRSMSAQEARRHRGSSAIARCRPHRVYG